MIPRAKVLAGTRPCRPYPALDQSASAAGQARPLNDEDHSIRASRMHGLITETEQGMISQAKKCVSRRSAGYPPFVV